MTLLYGEKREFAKNQVCYKPPVERTGQHPWLHPRWIRMGYCSTTKCARCFRCEDNNVDLMCVQSNYNRVRQVEPDHQFGEVARRFSWAVELLALCLNTSTSWNHAFQCEDSNADVVHVQPHYYRVRQVEPCHQLGWSSQLRVAE